MSLRNFISVSGVRWNFRTLLRFFSSEQRAVKTSYSFMPGNVVLLHDRLGDLVNQAADEAGDRIAYISHHQGLKKTFSEFRNSVDRLASGLVSLGLKKGDRIGLCAPNLYEWPVAQYAAAKAGLILVNINPAFQKDELEYCLNKVSCAAIITIGKVKCQNFYDMLCSIAPELPSSKPGSLKSEKLKHLRLVVLISEKHESGTITFNELSEAGDSKSDRLLDEMAKTVQFDDPALIQFTSGTTGYPKGGVLSHHNLTNNALVAGRRLGYHLKPQLVCLQIPLHHIFAFTLGTVTNVLFKHACVFPSAGYDCLSTIKAIEDYKCTTIYGTPTMFVDLANNYKPGVHNLSSLKQAVVGGAACPKTVFEAMGTKLNIQYVHNGYGTTECSPGVSISEQHIDLATASSGYAAPIEYAELKIVDDNGKVVPIGTKGELCVRGHMVFMGYWDEKEKTAEVMEKTNWYHTGDFAIMNEQGHTKIVARKKDMVIRGGENIFPLEIENFLHTNPAILEVHICSVPDERLGEELCAWIKLKDGEKLGEDDVKEYCKGKISHFKIPRYIMFVDDFPKTSTGKIQKYKMSEKSIELLKL